MSDGSSAPDSGTPEQRPPGWQPPSEPARTWTPPGYPPQAPGYPPQAPGYPPQAPGYPPPPPYQQAPPQAPYGQPQAPYAQPYGQPQPPYQQAPPQVPYGQPQGPYAQPYQPLYQARPVYKPGTIPLRPLGIGDMFNGSVETVRRNPKATIGIAAVVLTGFMLIPILGTLAWGGIQGFNSRITEADSADFSAEDVGLLITTLGGGLLSALATVVLTGMIVHVVEHAARGQKLSAGAAWTLTRPRVWRLLGLSAMTFLGPTLVIFAPIAVLVVLAFLASQTAGFITLFVGAVGGVALMVYLYIRLFQLAAANVVLEQRGVFSAMRRSWQLSRGQFWRLFGIALLTGIVVGFAGNVLTLPFQILAGVGPAIWPDTLLGVLVAVLAQNIAVIVSGALTTPFSASVAALQYLDQRIRKEGYDIQLIAQVPVPAQQ